MSSTSAVWKFMRDFATAVAEVAGRVLDPVHTIELVEHDDRHLVLRAGSREIVADSRFKTIKTNGRVVARFEQIKSIDIKRVSDDDSPDIWNVSLYLNWHSRVFIGGTHDSTQASIVGAHLSTVTGSKVIAFP